MIHPDSRTLPWIQEVAERYKFKEVQLIEKSIRAFSLLEALVRSGCPFVFKGGTSLMLHLNSSKRFILLAASVKLLSRNTTRTGSIAAIVSMISSIISAIVSFRISKTQIRSEEKRILFLQKAFEHVEVLI